MGKNKWQWNEYARNNPRCRETLEYFFRGTSFRLYGFTLTHVPDYTFRIVSGAFPQGREFTPMQVMQLYIFTN
jgi:hypothetical protein